MDAALLLIHLRLSVPLDLIRSHADKPRSVTAQLNITRKVRCQCGEMCFRNGIVLETMESAEEMRFNKIKLKDP